MAMRRLILFSAAVGIVAIAACEQAAIPTIAGLSGPVTGIDTSGANPSTSTLRIVPNTVQLSVGQSFQLSTSAPISQQGSIEWNTLNSNVATVSPQGLVTAVAQGSATITARFSFDTLHVATAAVLVVAPGAGAGNDRSP